MIHLILLFFSTSVEKDFKAFRIDRNPCTKGENAKGERTCLTGSNIEWHIGLYVPARYTAVIPTCYWDVPKQDHNFQISGALIKMATGQISPAGLEYL